jgi:alpha-tubulin suppressor-like RCC1 family protein
MVLCPWLASCDLGVVPFVCQRDEQCVDGAALGMCEPEGYCSFSDASCPDSGRRFGEHASPELSGQCVLTCIDAVALGGTHGCLIRTDGNVLCWGRNSHGQLGPGVAHDQVAGPTLVAGFPAVTAIALGARHSCAISVEGEAYCWGDDGEGQTGDPSLAPHADPRRVMSAGGALSEIAQLALGGDHTCALISGQSVWCWGSNGAGQLGLGASAVARSAEPQQVGTLTGTVRRVAAGGRSSCALVDASLYCWGSNVCGQLGLPNLPASDAPVPSLVRDLQGVVLGETHGCGEFGDGVRCWGDWAGAGCPDPTMAMPGDFEQRAVTVVAGARHSCMLGEGSETVQCWGSALCSDRSQDVNCGSLGPDSQDAYADPTNILLPESNLKGVAAGGTASCALSGSGRVWCWGSVEHGQLGIGEQLKAGVAVDYVSRQVVCPR